MNNVYKITADVVFPEGIAPGAESRSNKKAVARNGKNETVLRGSALAGVLRSAYANQSGLKSHDDKVAMWFGRGMEEEIDTGSILQIEDAVIKSKSINERVHNMINRHTGAMVDSGLFSIEAIPPMASTTISITLKAGAGEVEKYKEFISTIVNILGNGLVTGGNRNRGIGRMEVKGDIFLRVFDIDTIDGLCNFMDAQYQERKTKALLSGEKQKIVENTDVLKISLDFSIPRGEDLLIGDGQEMDYTLKPQSVMFADGTVHWRIPGSSLRGVIRAWMTRLAAREGLIIRDSIERWYEQYDESSPEKYKPDMAGWGFIDKKHQTEYQKDPALLKDPIMDLFGSMYKRGRIHITDSFAPMEEEKDTQDRMHVAVDRFSGGANEGALFNNQVLIEKKLKFSVTIFLESPTEDEIKWLIKTFRAIHLGILLVGSSKGGGRLEIKSITAKGLQSQAITKFAQELKKNDQDF